MNPILLHEGLLLRRLWQEHFGEIKSWLSLGGVLVLGVAIGVKNLPKFQTRLIGIDPWLLVVALALVPLAAAALLHWRAQVLARGSLVGDAVLRGPTLWALRTVVAVLAAAIALALLTVAMGPQLGEQRETFILAVSAVWLFGGLACSALLARGGIGGAAPDWQRAIARWSSTVAPGQLPPRQSALEAVVLQQAFVSSLGRLAAAIWGLPLLLGVIGSFARLVWPVAVPSFSGATLIAAFVALLVLGRVDFRTVRFLRTAGLGRRRTVGIHLIAPSLYAAILVVACAVLLGQPLPALVAVGAAMLLVAASVVLRCLCYREMGRAATEFYIQKWLWVSAIASVVFLPAAVVAVVLWGRHVVRLETGQPLD